MISSGVVFKDIIIEGDGRIFYWVFLVSGIIYRGK